jgi:streptomycin 6-kinase
VAGARSYPSYAEHPGLKWLPASGDGRAWLSSLDRLVDECVARWQLRVGDPFPYAFASLALPAELPDSTPAVLKVQFPDREGLYEAEALARWDGNGAVRLLGHDRSRRALLIERCLPGTALAESGGGAGALAVLGDLVERLSVEAGSPFGTLADESALWSESIVRWRAAHEGLEARYVDVALGYLRDLPGSQDGQVLVHQDLHAGNVLRAEREPWLAIDPKPLLGEPSFAVAPIVRGAELGQGPDMVRRRLDEMVERLALDHERARGWTIAQSLAWGIVEGGILPVHLDVVHWLIDAP